MCGGALQRYFSLEHKRKKLGPKIADVIFLGPKIVDDIFLGNRETTTAMRFLVVKSDIDGIVVNTIVEFRDATFFEKVFPMKAGIP